MSMSPCIYAPEAEFGQQQQHTRDSAVLARASTLHALFMTHAPNALFTAPIPCVAPATYHPYFRSPYCTSNGAHESQVL